MVNILKQKFYYVEDLVKILKVSDFTIREYLKAGKLKGRKIAKRWLVSEEEFKNFLEKGVQE